MEEFQRDKLYSYKNNSNLVLEADRDNKQRRNDEGKGEVETLNGRLNTIRMGDRIAGNNTTGSAATVSDIEKIKRKRGNNSSSAGDDVGDDSNIVLKKSSSSSLRGNAATSVLTMSLDDLDSIGYRPKTRDSKIVYEEILSFVQLLLGDQPHDILRSATDEVLAILKDDSMKDNDRHREINKMLSPIPSEKFNHLVNLGKRIVDFNVNDENADVHVDDNKMDEDMGVAVIFDDEDEDNDGNEFQLEEVEEEEEEDDDNNNDAGGDDDGDYYNSNSMPSVVVSGSVLKDKHEDRNTADDVEDDKDDIKISDIDAHWLQRLLSKYYSDAIISAKLAEDTLEVLQLIDERVCENKLVLLLDFDKFDVIKLLLRNRYKIYYCIKLRQANSDDDRLNVEKLMSNDLERNGPQLLQRIYTKASVERWAQDRISENTSKTRKESRSLNKKATTDAMSISITVTDINDNDNEDTKTHNFTDKDVSKSRISGSSGSSGSSGNDNGQRQAQQPVKNVDLESLQFHQGSHLMTNSKCELPSKSWRAQKKGYEEVHVPAVRPIVPADEVLCDIADLPEWSRPAFAGIKSLNRIQSKMVQAALYSSENILLCAPTGAGKTNVALLCMLNTIGQYVRVDGSVDLNAFKIVYVAPMKALVQECVLTFGKKLAPFGITVRELSGDQNLTKQQIKETQVIITTPEKWDIITRKSGERTYTQLVKLMIIDEIHLLHDDRGPVLESLVARTVRQVEASEEVIRLVGLSATLPNYEDVATFLRVDDTKGLFFFDSSYRPVPLQQQYIGITEKKALKRFQLMNEICYEKVLQQAGKNQVLIFTHSRAETVKTARALRDMAVANDATELFIQEDSASKEILREEADTGAKNMDLKDLLPFGFAIHHAGLVRSDRTLVEDLFSDKHIQVLVSTATLAWGVNLPCHTVILKGTQMYSPEKGAWVELSPLDIMQMMGRAGRYGLDSEGEGIIITAHSELQYYLSLMNQQLPIESQLIKKLPDLLNAEIVLGTVSSIKEAASWLGYTYLYVRMLRNPHLYGISDDKVTADPTLYQRRLDLSHAAASILDKHNLIKYDRKSNNFQVTTLGRVASYYYVSHDSIHTFNEHLRPSMSDVELFRLFSLSGEFKNIHVRDEEKLELAKLVTRVPIPIKEGNDEPSAKINVLLQAYISNLKLDGFALAADRAYVQQSGCRLMRALFEIALKRGWSALACKTLCICQMIERKVWSSQNPLRQFGTIPEILIRKLEKNSDIPWSRYFDLKPQDFGEMCKLPKMGKSIYKYVHMFPNVLLSTSIQPLTRSLLKVDLTITPDFQYDYTVHDNAQVFLVIVEDGDGEMILHQETFILRINHCTEDHIVTFTVPISEPFPPQYFIRVVSDRWLHAQAVLPVSFKHLLLPAKFNPPTELLDLHPLPVATLNSTLTEEYLHLYSSKQFRYFNPIQTQTYSSLYETDESIFIGAPTGSGKTVCAEFALLRLFMGNRDGKCVYIAPKQDIADGMYATWKHRFASLSVVMLTGDTAVDLKLIEVGNIIIAAADKFDSISRRWKQRKHIQSISMYIVDEIHLLGSMDGPTLEVTLSRVRKMSSLLSKHIRIVALGSPIANAKDIGDWLGVSTQYMYNFSPDVRPVPLEIYFQGFDMCDSNARILAMTKPVYNTILNHSIDKPVMVFVSSRKQSLLTAIDMISFAAVHKKSDRFLHINTENSTRFDSMVSSVKDASLVQTLMKGVGYLQPSLHESDQAIVRDMYDSGVIQVLVCTYDLCWSIASVAHLVVIMDTVYYDGHTDRYVDYSITDVIQMVGKSCRPLLDESGKCAIYCHTPRKEYLKKLLHDPLPIESHLDHYIHDHVCAEIVAKTIDSKENAVDYMTWTLFYRRLTQNPNYYSLQGISNDHISDYLSELVEQTVTELEESKCIAVEDDMELSALNLGMIASYYYIQYTTVELFASSISAKTKIRGVMEILAAASEYSVIPIRQSEVKQLLSFSKHLPQGIPATARCDDPATKVYILLQAHFSRLSIQIDWSLDTRIILRDAVKLLQALVDVISSQGWLKPALAAMELSQMIVQGLWDKDSPLLQIPHFTKETVDRCVTGISNCSDGSSSERIETVYDILEVSDDTRNQLLQMTSQQLSDVAMFCNSYPSLEVTYVTDFDDRDVSGGDTATVTVTIQKDDDDDGGVNAGDSSVICPRYPHKKSQSWWLVLGDSSSNTLLSIKRFTCVKASTTVKLDFAAPEDGGQHQLTLYLMCDSYMGCDQEYELSMQVVKSSDDADSSDAGSSDGDRMDV